MAIFYYFSILLPCFYLFAFFVVSEKPCLLFQAETAQQIVLCFPKAIEYNIMFPFDADLLVEADVCIFLKIRKYLGRMVSLMAA